MILPLALGALALSAVSVHAGLLARAAGRPAAPALVDPVRESARLLVQQPRRIPGADLLLARLGLLGLPVMAVLAVLVVPVGHWVVDSSIGIVWFNLADVGVWAALWLIGWGANSAWGLVGGYRFLAQGLAYELPHMFALITVALGTGSLRMADVVDAQHGLWFVVWMPVAFLMYLVSALALSVWGPFAAPLGRDIAGGAGVELAGVDRLVLLAGRAMLLAATAAMAVPLFLGGGMGPWLPAWLWSLLKTLAVLGLLVWLGTRGPAIRMERFTEVGWLVLIPATLLQALVVAVVVL